LCPQDPIVEQEQAVSGFYRQIVPKVSPAAFLNSHGLGDESGESRNFAKLIRTSDTGIPAEEVFHFEQSYF
jgi:hypothetical protein